MDKKFLDTLRLELGGLIVEIISDDCILDDNVNIFQKHFIISEEIGPYDIIFRIHLDEVPMHNYSKKIIEYNDKESTRRLLQTGDNLILQSNSSEYPFQYSVIMDTNHNSCDFYFQNKNLIIKHGINFLARQFRIVYILMFNFLQSFNGLILHACAIENDGYGQVFVGKSGSGKSTLAKISKSKKTCFILCDETVIIRKLENKFRIYGTPWVSDVKDCSPRGAILDNIFFIEHAEINLIEHLSNIYAITSLLNSSWFNAWSLNSMNSTFNLLDQLTREIPLYKLRFVPNEDVLNFTIGVK